MWSILCGEEGFGALEVSLDHSVKVGHLVHLASVEETCTVYQSEHRDRERETWRSNINIILDLLHLNTLIYWPLFISKLIQGFAKLDRNLHKDQTIAVLH